MGGAGSDKYMGSMNDGSYKDKNNLIYHKNMFRLKVTHQKGNKKESR